MTLVSIIIPSHNSAKTLNQCISSARNQTYTKLQIIVVNDKSTDDTLGVLESIADPRLRVLTTSYGSASAARNAGLQVALGEYIQFLDADDILAENKIQTQINTLSQASPLSVANCPWGHFTASTTESAIQHQPIDRDIAPIDWLIGSWNGGGMAQTACWLTPSRLIKAAGTWNESLTKNPNDDGEFFCRVLLHADQIYFTPETKIFYRLPVDGSVSRVQSHQQAISLLNSYIECEKHIRVSEDSTRTRAAAAQNYYRFIYEFGRLFPASSQVAAQRIAILGHPPCTSVGSPRFKRLVNIFGFNIAMIMRNLLTFRYPSRLATLARRTRYKNTATH
jgi:glycosyltransferase involved in cell wall biosynthesis